MPLNLCPSPPWFRVRPSFFRKNCELAISASFNGNIQFRFIFACFRRLISFDFLDCLFEQAARQREPDTSERKTKQSRIVSRACSTRTFRRMIMNIKLRRAAHLPNRRPLSGI